MIFRKISCFYCCCLSRDVVITLDQSPASDFFIHECLYEFSTNAALINAEKCLICTNSYVIIALNCQSFVSALSLF